nr:hypothetical protein [Legionella adelaidensis]
MTRQSLLYLFLSILVVIFAEYAQLLIVYIDMVYTWTNVELAPVFSSVGLGNIVRQVFTLVIIPVGIAAIPALIYRLIKGENMPYLIPLSWLLWLILVLSKVLIR